MKIGIITNIRAPYRKLQIEEFNKNKDFCITVYYIEKNILGRSWNVESIHGVKEVALEGYKISKKYGMLNKGLLKIVLENDFLLIGGYEQPTYILLSILARIFRKPYAIIFDGISPIKIKEREHWLKYFLKYLVISGASAIFGNGTCSKNYFINKFKCKEEKIYNQFLTVDIEKIIDIGKKQRVLRENLRKKYNIAPQKNVLLYSGRLIPRKNVDKVIKAISRLEYRENIVLFIMGDGPERENLERLAKELNVDIRITGFIKNQTELFEHYYVGDLLLLVSNNEPWGLVINEAMAAGLPVIVSEECGASLDLVKDGYNGFIVNPNDIVSLANKIETILTSGQSIQFGNESKKIIENWNFRNSRLSFERMVYSCRK